MYKLYIFQPDLVWVEGYKYEKEFETEQECNQEAFALNQNYFRIEMETDFGSAIIYESQIQEQA